MPQHVRMHVARRGPAAPPSAASRRSIVRGVEPRAARADEQRVLARAAQAAARSASHRCSASRARPPTGTMRSFAPLPQTRTSPFARSMPSTSRPASSDSAQARRIRELEQRAVAQCPASSVRSMATQPHRFVRRQRRRQALRRLRRLEARRTGRPLCARRARAGSGRTRATPKASRARLRPRQAARVQRRETRARAARVSACAAIVGACDRANCAHVAQIGVARMRGARVARCRCERERAARRRRSSGGRGSHGSPTGCDHDARQEARGRDARELGEARQVERAHAGMEALASGLPSASRPKVCAVRKRQERERLRARRRPRTTRAISNAAAGPQYGCPELRRRTRASPPTSPQARAGTTARAPCPTAATATCGTPKSSFRLW